MTINPDVNIKIGTMSTHEAVDFLRSCGMSISCDTLRLGIEQGVYPWGICITGNTSPVYQIFTRQLVDWARERSMEGMVRNG